eukprot:3594686-Pyramimonas_sp.AAC.1
MRATNANSVLQQMYANTLLSRKATGPPPPGSSPGRGKLGRAAIQQDSTAFCAEVDGAAYTV